MVPFDFSWTAPETCPTRADVVAELSKAVDSGGRELPPLTAHAVVVQDGATWRLELMTEMDGRRGTRLLEADSCEGLARAATLVLALTVGEGLERRRQAEVEARAAPPPPPKVPPPAPPPAQRRSEPTRMLLSAAVAVGSDPLGTFGPSMMVGIAFQPNLLKFGARVEAALPRSTQFLDSGAGGDVQSVSNTFDLQVCLAPTLEPLEFSACALGAVTVLDAEGQGTALDSRANLPLYSIGPSVGASWLLHESAFLELSFLSRFYLARPELVVEGLPQRRQIEPMSVSGLLGGGVRW